jgi:exosortase/archaeosortase family protein
MRQTPDRKKETKSQETQGKSSTPAQKGEATRPMDRRPALLFILALAFCMLAFNLLLYRNVATGQAWETYLSANARCAGWVLETLGEPVKAIGASLRSPKFNLDIKSGCDSVQASAFLVFAILLSPIGVRFRLRLLPVAYGVAFLAALNIFRIVTLYFAGVHLVKWFDFIHGELWQGLFTLAPLIWWLAWTQRNLAGRKTRAQAS